MSYALAAGLILLADRVSKHLVMANMHDGESIPIIPPIFYLTYVQNRGAAFGLFQGRVAVLSLVALVCLSLVLMHWKKLKAKSAFVRWGVVISVVGALGNLLDRLRWGAVIVFFGHPHLRVQRGRCGHCAGCSPAVLGGFGS